MRTTSARCPLVAAVSGLRDPFAAAVCGARHEAGEAPPSADRGGARWTIALGPFRRWLPITSAPETCALSITAVIRILHTDWKIDLIQWLGRRGHQALQGTWRCRHRRRVCDSTNALQAGHSPSEEVAVGLGRAVAACEGVSLSAVFRATLRARIPWPRLPPRRAVSGRLRPLRDGDGALRAKVGLLPPDSSYSQHLNACRLLRCWLWRRVVKVNGERPCID